MENRNLEKALDIVSKLITGEELTERGDNSSLYQEYNNNAEIYDIVHMSLKKLNLSIYEYNNGLYVSAGENNRVFGYTNEELRKELGIKANKDLYMAYFVIYNIITEFYTASSNTTYVEFVKVEDIVKNVDYSVLAIIDKKLGMNIDDIEENSFKQIALSWDELPVITVEDTADVRAARNSKTGFVKMVLNFCVSQGLLMEAQSRYYPTDRFKALIENYFDEYNTTVHFISEEELKRDHSKMPHGGFVIRTGETGEEGNKHVIEYSLKLDSNPEFTASVLIAYARAAYRLNQKGENGARSVFDIAPALLSMKTPEQLRKEIL